MGLINRVAISNVLNHHGESLRAPWSPRMRYECLEFRGQSTAINLTNGGGKTTLAEAIIGLLSRDQVLISSTKKKLSPKSSRLWSHIQVELIRPKGSSAQADILSSAGNQANGEHWVFGMYGHRSEQSITYYYFQGILEDLPIGFKEGSGRRLQSNKAFNQIRKDLGVVMSPTAEEWSNTLSLKVGVTPQVVKQLANFQKRGGQDKSAMMFDIKPRSGESYAEAFFYQVLAPNVMEGVMDREGEEGEVSLEDTVERAVFSTVRAKQDTQYKRVEVDNLQLSVSKLTGAMEEVRKVRDLRQEYDRELEDTRVAVKVLSLLVGDGHLPGIPREFSSDHQLKDVLSHLVIEAGKKQLRIHEKGLAKLVGKSTSDLYEVATSMDVLRDETMAGVCLPNGVVATLKAKSMKTYNLQQAISLVRNSQMVSGHANDRVVGLLEDAQDHFLDKNDTNPFREVLEEIDQELHQLKERDSDIDRIHQSLIQKQTGLMKQQSRMEANEGHYNDLVESGHFTAAELESPEATWNEVKAEYDRVRQLRSIFDNKNTSISQLDPHWQVFCEQFGQNQEPVEIKNTLEQQREQVQVILTENREQAVITRRRRDNEIGEKHRAADEISRSESPLEQLAKCLPMHEKFIQHFGGVSPAGLERKFMQALKSTSEQYAFTDARVSNLLIQLNSIERFKAEVSQELEPARWLEGIELERDERALELHQRKGALEDIRQQRQVLESESIAPNKATKLALSVLSGLSLSVTPLHKAIEVMSLPMERRRDVLGVFSSLLFAPVLTSETDALAAAKAFEGQGVQLPVFVSTSLEAYCQEGEISRGAEDELLIGAVAGTLTRAAQCLLDPALVEREKQKLDSDIIVQEESIAQLQILLEELSESNRRVVLARQAARALADDVPTLHEVASQELADLSVTKGELENKTSDENLQVLRGAEQFEKLGGRAKHEELMAKISQARETIKILNESIEEAEQLIESLERKEVQLQSQISDILPQDLVVTLSYADKFYTMGGPVFMQTREAEELRLEEMDATAHGRYKYERSFGCAQAYLDEIQAKVEGVTIEIKLGEINQQLIDNRKEYKKTRADIDKVNASMPALISAMDAIDRTAILAIRRYRYVVDIQEDVGQAQVDAETLEMPAIKLNDDLRGCLSQDKDPEKVKTLAERISVELEEIDVESKADELTRRKNALEEQENRFLNAIRSIIDKPDGLRPAEQQLLREIQGAQDVHRLEDLYRNLLDQLNEQNERLEQLERSEREARQNVTARLAHLIEYAATDLEILKRVVRVQHSETVSYFNIDATVLPREDIQGLMDSILDEADIREGQRRERSQHGFNEDESKHRDELRTFIRDRLYKTIFRDPKITFVNVMIRAAGNANEFNNSLSEGQKAALSLMWSIRLAEFSIEREAKKLSSRRSQLKAREQSTIIMIVDGLFSNLSSRLLINSSMAGIEGTRGRFQLIGLIHNPHYENDSAKFPVYINGKTVTNGHVGADSSSSVVFKNASEEEMGTVQFSQIRHLQDG